MQGMVRINIGCGMSPTDGWINYDNSFSVKLAKNYTFAKFLHKIGFIHANQINYINFCRKSNILWADATKKIPLADNIVDIIYSSHMIEHLDRDEVKSFLKEANRVMKFGGIIRIVVPDLEKKVMDYIKNKDADVFIESTGLCNPALRSIREKLKKIVIGDRNHLWMYDGNSLVRLLQTTGFSNPSILEAGKSTIDDPGGLNLFERKAESVYVEAVKI